MAPERLRGHCDAASDVYSLGLTLYELLTLQPAFEEVGRDPLMMRVRLLRAGDLSAVDVAT
jgi:serine/threonine protein kinase